METSGEYVCQKTCYYRQWKPAAALWLAFAMAGFGPRPASNHNDYGASQFPLGGVFKKHETRKQFL